MNCKNRASMPAEVAKRGPGRAAQLHSRRARLRRLARSWRSRGRVRQSRRVNGLDAVRDTFDGMKRRSKTARKARSPERAAASAKRGGKPDSLDVLVTAAAQALALPLDPAWHDGIKFNLRLVMRMAAQVDEFPLPDSAEPAPVFHA